METYRRADAVLIEDVTRHIGEHHDLPVHGPAARPAGGGTGI